MTPTSRLVVMGAGGHAGVLVDAWTQARWPRLLGLLDPRPEPGTVRHGLPVLGDDRWLDDKNPADLRLILGIGHQPGNTIRLALAHALRRRGFQLSGVRHPAATVSPKAELAPGVQVLAGAVVNPGASIGVDTIINSRSVIEHDVTTGPLCHVAPGAIVCGDVVMGEGVFIGAGAIILPGVRLGDGALVAAGAVVTGDIAAKGRADRC